MTANNNFHALRLCAAVAVLVGHCGIIVPPGTPFLFDRFWSVRLFFWTSGYLLAGSWQADPHAGRYVKRRALRILPGLFVCTIFTAFVWGPLMTHWGQMDYWSSYRLWIYPLFGTQLLAFFAPTNLPGVEAHMDEVNTSLWTIPYEIGAYAMLLAFGKMRLLRRTWFLGGVIAAFVVWHEARADGSYDPTWMGYLHARHDAYFFLGVLCHVCHERIPRSTIGCVVALALQLWVRQLEWLATPYILLCISLEPNVWLPRLETYGDFSYGIYIYASLMLTSFDNELELHPSGLLFFVVLACTIPLAVASWFLVEKPMLSLKPKRPAPDTPTSPDIVLLTIGET